MFNLEVVYLFQFEVNGRFRARTLCCSGGATSLAFPTPSGLATLPVDSLRLASVRSMARPTNEERMAEMARAGEENRREVSLAFSSFAHAIDGADIRC